jgi:hypothetical protein
MKFGKTARILTGLACLAATSATQARTTYPKIYPFVPFKVSDIDKSLRNITEDENYIDNFYDVISQNLSRAKTKVKPWTSTYWPLNKGLIADPYESTFVGYYVERGFVSWSKNYNTFTRRKNGVLKNIDKLNEGQLATLAPSEKYDLLLGDYSFDLTNRLWDYMQKWGNKKEFGFLSSLSLVGEDALGIANQMVAYGWFETVDDAFVEAYQLRGSLAVEEALRLVKSGRFNTVEDAMPLAIQNALSESQNYVLEKKNNLMAFWEGICHGWATAAGVIPRPRKTVEVELPDGRKLKFYPTDLKALASLLWANSLIQDNKYIDDSTGENIGGGVISEGLRCNLENPKKDAWGRYYDHKPDPFNGDHSPRCVGVHPAIWHLGLVNLIGKQGRSFIVERKVGEEVDNHPMYSYTMKYFNPNSGRSNRNINKNVVAISKKDQFRKFRNPNTRYLVGVETKMTYIDWQRPKRYITDNERFDKTEEKKMFYDLELDANYKVIGGQWRAAKSGKVSSNRHGSRNGNPNRMKKGNYNQPDFFWVITKDWKPFFKELTDVEEWTDTSKVPPTSWKERALKAHEFIYHKKYKYGTGSKCKVVNTRTGQSKEVSCEYEDPKPQPLVNVVNKLIELAK